MEPTPRDLEDRIGQEQELVLGAMRAVAAGAGSSVLVAGLRFGPALLTATRPQARRLGVEVEPTEHNRRYLETKRDKLGHLLGQP